VNQNIENLQVITHSDGYIYVGGNNFTDGNPTVFISKYDEEGNILWTQQYTNYPQMAGSFKQMIIENNYIYILASLKDTSTSKRDILTLKYTTNGILLLDLVYNAPDNLDDAPKAILV